MTTTLTRLPNGMRVVTEAAPGFASAAVGLWVLEGARSEAAEENGIAHFLEHMAFKGTKRRTARQIAEEIEDVGGYLNAYTSRETTAYYARVLGEHVPLALDLIADIVLNSVFDGREIEVERGVILSEIGQAADTPDDIIFDWLQEVAYPDQPFGRPILGRPELVSRFTRADLQRFVSRHYAPSRMILAAAGNIDADAVHAFAEKTFGPLAPREAPAWEPAIFAAGEKRVERDLEQAHFALAFPGPAVRDATVHAAQIHAIALGGGMSSRLFQEIREKRGLCYSISAHAAAFADTGTLTIYAGTGRADLAALSELVIDELRRTADGFSAAEIERARQQMRAGLLMGQESAIHRAERLARTVEIWDRVVPIEETLARIEAVDAHALRTHAERLLADPRPALALYGPVAAAPHVSRLAERAAA